MRIAMLCSSHMVNDARVTYKQAVSLSEAGHRVVVFGREPKTNEKIAGVELVPLAPLGGGLPSRVKMIPKLIAAAVAWRPDVVTCHEPASAVVGLFLKVRYGTKVIFDSHECSQETLSWRMPGVLRPIVRAATTIFLRLLIPRCDWVTVVSPPNKKFLGAMRRDGRIDILHNSPTMEFFPPCNHDVDGPITVVHEGYLYKQRGMVQMLEAVAIVRRTRDIRFLIVGRILPDDQELFDRKVAELDLAKVIIIPGWKPWGEIGRIESQAQIGLICHQYTPNSFLSLNNKLYNYASCGQAIIGPKGSATAEMLRKYDCGLCVDTTNPQEIADAILKLAQDVGLRKRLGANGRRAIEQELGWHKMEERLRRIYDQLDNDRRR